jgi:hypothetical protein
MASFRENIIANHFCIIQDDTGCSALASAQGRYLAESNSSQERLKQKMHEPEEWLKAK